MRKYPKLAWVLAKLIGIPWAKNMAKSFFNIGNGSIWGKIISAVGEPICGFIGRNLKEK